MHEIEKLKRKMAATQFTYKSNHWKTLGNIGLIQSPTINRPKRLIKQNNESVLIQSAGRDQERHGTAYKTYETKQSTPYAEYSDNQSNFTQRRVRNLTGCNESYFAKNAK